MHAQLTRCRGRLNAGEGRCTHMRREACAPWGRKRPPPLPSNDGALHRVLCHGVARTPPRHVHCWRRHQPQLRPHAHRERIVQRVQRGSAGLRGRGCSVLVRPPCACCCRCPAAWRCTLSGGRMGGACRPHDLAIRGDGHQEQQVALGPGGRPQLRAARAAWATACVRPNACVVSSAHADVPASQESISAHRSKPRETAGGWEGEVIPGRSIPTMNPGPSQP